MPANPPATGPGAAGALPVLPGASPQASPSLLSQVDRPPIVPTGPDTAARQPVPPEPVLRSADDTSRADLGGRALAFLIGGVAFLLLAIAIAASLIGNRLRRDRDEKEAANPPAGPRPDDGRRVREHARPAAILLDVVRPGNTVGTGAAAGPGDDTVPHPVSTPLTLPDVVRRTSEAGPATDPPHRRPATDPALGSEHQPARSVVDE